ncbi:MAG: hypothetical protein A2W19_05650 [Spirochaetes bacterium RBG_16_49_21]|nr:MAG: hypothetical protein A2W19_05650 [Spirochaetes bacterium RBG_16_49_21]
MHESQKKKSIEINVYDTLYTDKVDGLYTRIMKSRGAERLMRKKLNPFTVVINSRKIARLLGFPWLKLALGIAGMGISKSIQLARMAIGFEAFKAGTMEGDNDKGVLPMGQVSGIIHDTLTVKQIIERIVREAKSVHKAVAPKV